MTQLEWAKLKGWFGEATDGTSEDAERAMAAAEAESPELARQLRELLGAHEAKSFDTRAVTDQIPREEAGARESVGPYRLVRELGRGGTGIVFLAERADDEFHRPVALKLMRYVVWDRNNSELLTRERRALAQLRHRNIAALIDWGAGDDGVPWLAVEYVDGGPIDQYCKGRGVDEALELFEQVCEGVQFAHQHLVVHGDLKPANIFVGADGTVKLLDFGISRLLDAEAATVTVERRFTPAYASPEQLEGKAIGVATDVYALGLILYELLTGEPRYAGGTMESVVRRVLEGEEARPSARRKAIAGDLDLIVLHALERDPARRYATADQLLADVRAWRGGYPVRARKPGAGYRFSKFVRRNKLAVGAAALAVAAMAGGTGLALWKQHQAQVAQREAEQRYEELQKLAHSVIFDLHDAINRVPGSLAARRKLVETGLRYLDSLRASHVKDDALQMEMAAGYYRMAYAQGGIVGMNLGDAVGGRKSYRIALGILDEQWRRHYGDATVGSLRDAVAFNYALSMNDPAAGVAVALPYAAEADEWARRNPVAGVLHSDGLLHQTLGRLRRNTGEFELSLAELDKAAELFTRMNRIAIEKPVYGMAGAAVSLDEGLHMLAITGMARAGTLLDMGRWEDCLAAVRQARADEGKVLEMDRDSPAARRTLAVSYGMASQALMGEGKRAEAVAEARREVEAVREFLGRDASSVVARRDMSQAQRHLGYTARDAGMLKAGAEEMGAIADADPAFLYNRVLEAGTLNEWAEVVGGAAGREIRGRALGIAEGVVREAPGWWEARRQRDRAALGHN